MSRINDSIIWVSISCYHLTKHKKQILSFAKRKWNQYVAIGTVPATADDDTLAASADAGWDPAAVLLSPAAAATTVVVLAPGLAATILTPAAALGRPGHLAAPCASPTPPPGHHALCS